MADAGPQPETQNRTPNEVLREALNLGVIKRLKELGYRKKGLEFLKTGARVMHIINGRATGNGDRPIGIIRLYFDFSVRFLEAHESNLKSNCRIFGDLSFSKKSADRDDRFKDSWTISGSTNINQLGRELLEFFDVYCLPWLEKHSEPRTAADAIVSLQRGDLLKAAKLYHSLNETELAKNALLSLLESNKGLTKNWIVNDVKLTAQELGIELPNEENAVDWKVQGPHWFSEAAWQICENPFHTLAILQFIQAADPRLCRLASVHLVRSQISSLSNEQQRALTTAERYAEGLIKSVDLITFPDGMREDTNRQERRNQTAHPQAFYAAQTSLPFDRNITPNRRYYTGPKFDSMKRNIELRRNYYSQSMSILHDLFGNPFRPFSLDPSLRTESVVALASSIYTSRDYSQLPILADLLEENGCDLQELLNHLRSQQRHYLGCWALDAVLGKREK